MARDIVMAVDEAIEHRNGLLDVGDAGSSFPKAIVVFEDGDVSKAIDDLSRAGFHVRSSFIDGAHGSDYDQTTVEFYVSWGDNEPEPPTVAEEVDEELTGQLRGGLIQVDAVDDKALLVYDTVNKSHQAAAYLSTVGYQIRSTFVNGAHAEGENTVEFYVARKGYDAPAVGYEIE